jgi:hypothetical protein
MKTHLIAAQRDSHHLLQPRESLDFHSQNGALFNRPGRGFPPKSFRRQNDSPAGQHNVVDIDRIRQGLDVRTTVSFPCLFRSAPSPLTHIEVMLRNIPNKITQVKEL